jgi:uncharacterized membrane protein YbhN (UPF0104 family)
MNAKSLIKFLLSLLMVVIVFRSVDFENLRTTFLSMSPLAAILVIVGYTVGQLLSSVKWWTITRAGGIRTPYSTALKVYFIGMFVNCFSFGMVGGDAVRGILVAQGQPKKTEGIASVIADRIHGLTVLSCLALATSFFIGNDRVPQNLIQFLWLMVLGFIGAWLIGPWILVNFPLLKNTKLSAKLQQVAAIFPRDPKTLAVITGISVVFHTLQISLHAVMAAGMGIDIPLATLFVVIPFVNIASSLPISWQGLGVRENSYIFFLTAAPAIVSKEQAVAFGALWLLAVTVSSAIGGIVALVSGDLRTLKSTAEKTPLVGQNPETIS